MGLFQQIFLYIYLCIGIWNHGVTSFLKSRLGQQEPELFILELNQCLMSKSFEHNSIATGSPLKQ